MTAIDQVLGTGDGTTAAFQLVKTYGSLYSPYQRPIAKPVPGSVRVAVGQRVRRGEVLGEVGLSGSGGWPHLHFHVADGPSLLGAEGLPFAFDAFELLGRYGDFEQLGQAPWKPQGAGMRRGERPPDNAVLRFPD